MKLQKNNKYSKRIASGILSLFVGVTLLQGCKDNSEIEITYPIVETTICTEPTYVEETENTEPIMTEPTEVTKPYDDMSMRKLPEDELQKEIEDLCIVFNDGKYCFSYFYCVMFKNSCGEDKIMLTTIKYDDVKSECVVRDLFTREILFKYVSNEEKVYDNFMKKDIEIYDENVYFYGASNISVDVCIEMLNFANLMRITWDEDLVYSYYPVEFVSNELYYSMEEMAEIYINLIPKKFRVDAADLGVKNIPDENKQYTIGRKL